MIPYSIWCGSVLVSDGVVCAGASKRASAIIDSGLFHGVSLCLSAGEWGGEVGGRNVPVFVSHDGWEDLNDGWEDLLDGSEVCPFVVN